MNWQSVFEKHVEEIHQAIADADESVVVHTLTDMKSIITCHILREVKKYYDFKLKVIHYNVEGLSEEIQPAWRKRFSPFKTKDITKEFLISSNGIKSSSLLEAYINFKKRMLTDEHVEPIDYNMIIQDSYVCDDYLQWLQSR